MKLNTTRFGEIEIDEKAIIDFPLGIPGFPGMKRYVLIDYKDPIRWLQAIDDPDVAFIVTDPFTLFPDYSFEVKDEVEQFLEIKEPGDIVILAILNVSENAITANLKAPIVANVSSLKAAQVLLDEERFSFKAPLPALPGESN